MTHVFGYILTILARTKCRLVIKHVLSITHFHLCFFLTFPFKFYLYKKFKLSIEDYLLFIYTFMCMIIFLRIIILSFQSHQTRILSAGLGMAWKCDSILYAAEIYIFLKSLFFVSQRGKCTQKLRNPNISGDGRGQIHLKITKIALKLKKTVKNALFYHKKL